MRVYETIRNNCKTVAEEIEIFASKNKYRCPICGEIIEWDDASYDPAESMYTCHMCMQASHEGDFEHIGFEDFFLTRDFVHTIYRLDDNGKYHSVRTELKRHRDDETVIFIDTDRQAVYGLRFFTEVEWGLSLDAIAALDGYFENTMNNMLYGRG